MAYADKSCDMRRVCIAQGGHVEWEGVEIDGCEFILSCRNGWGELASSLYLKKEDVLGKIKEFNSDLESDEEPQILLYQDEEDCNWDVKYDYVKKIAEKTGNIKEKKDGK